MVTGFHRIKNSGIPAIVVPEFYGLFLLGLLELETTIITSVQISVRRV